MQRLPALGMMCALCAGSLALHGAPPARTRVALLITGGIVVTMDAERRVLAPGAVAIDGTDIVAVGNPKEVAARVQPRATIDATSQVVMPGLVNTHTHAAMVLYRGLADDLTLMDWLQNYIFPAEAKTVSPAFVRAGTRLAAFEMIQSGTTTYTDMYYFEEEVAAVTRNAGLRGVLGQTIIQFAVPDAKTPAAALERADRFIRQWKGDPLVTPAIAPHSMYTLDATTLTAARDVGRRHGVPVLIHLAETRDELKIAAEKHQQTPTAFLAAIGFLGPRTVAAHGVWLDERDIGVLKAAGVGIAHNPESNMKLASGIAPVPTLLAAGVAVGLGTDGAASNNDLDMFEAMRQAAFLHKVQSGNPRAVSSRVALEMATLGGARALGMEDTIGSLVPGKRADVILIGTDRARQTPMYDPISHLVYVTRGDDVRTTIVNGKILMRDRVVRTLDERSVLADARAWARKVSAAVR